MQIQDTTMDQGPAFSSMSSSDRGFRRSSNVMARSAPVTPTRGSFRFRNLKVEPPSESPSKSLLPLPEANHIELKHFNSQAHLSFSKGRGTFIWRKGEQGLSEGAGLLKVQVSSPTYRSPKGIFSNLRSSILL